MSANATTTVTVYNTGTTQVDFNVTPSVAWLNAGELASTSPACTASGAADCVAAEQQRHAHDLQYGYSSGQSTSGTLTLTPIASESSVAAATVYVSIGGATTTGTLAAPTSLTFTCQSQYCAQPVPLSRRYS